MWVIKSRSMTGRAGLTRLPSASSTFTPPKAGTNFASGSKSVQRASSSSVMRPTQTIGFVIE